MNIHFEKYEEELIKLRREFHKIPETAFLEFETSKKIKEYLSHLGIEDIKEYAKTGVAATIYGNGSTDKTVALRADIDALPVLEQNEVDYKSTFPGKMHACGHDGHIAMNLIIAKIFSENKELLKGNLKLIFQPAEEGNGGAEPMIKEGVLENPKVQYVLGGHLWPDIDTGKIDITYKATFAASNKIKIVVNGQGGHGALPHKVKDCIFAGSQIIIALKELSQKYNLEEKMNVLSICSFDCASFYNVFKDNAYLDGTLRTLDLEVQNQMKKDIVDCVNEIFKINELSGECHIIDEYPPLMNDDQVLSMVEKSAKEILGDNIVSFGPTMGAEDFAYFANSVPSAHIKIGTKTEGENYPLHHAKYNINERSLLIGVKVFVNSILRLLNKE